MLVLDLQGDVFTNHLSCAKGSLVIKIVHRTGLRGDNLWSVTLLLAIDCRYPKRGHLSLSSFATPDASWHPSAPPWKQ